jgi:lipopolysaccharide transport system ATP-binding protein
MSQPAIEVSALSKRYMIQHESRHDSLRDTLHHIARKLWRRFRWNTGFQTEEFWALRDLSFAVQPGEVVGIIGRNGAGKSTLLKILSRITEPTSGKIKLRGRVASLLEVGTGFHPDLSGRENIYLNGAILGMSRVEIARKFDEIVAFAEVERFLDTPVKRYSSGMYVRLAFAVAAHLEPEILIVDEVLAVGDAQFQQKCLGRMQKVVESRGQTIFFVSHNLKAVEHFCTRGLMLEQGRLTLDAPARTVVAEYLRKNAVQPEMTRRELSDEMDLEELSFAPSPATVRDPVAFAIALRARQEAQIHDFHLFIHNSFGDRAAVVDLRRGEGSRTLAAGRQLRITGRIPRINLVEGDYRIGLCLRTSRHFGVFPDLIPLQLAAGPAPAGLLPIPSEYLGTALLDYTFDDRVS